MSIEVRPLNVACNIQCSYCYQQPQRDSGGVSRSYDLQKIKDAISDEGRPFVLFGGEPLLLPIKDLEDLWSWGYQRFGGNSLQTNGTLINDEHIRLFRTYRVHVGISVDGPGELNDARWHVNLQKTRESTGKTHAAIERLCQEGMTPALIVTLHRVNASADRLPALVDWMRDLARRGVRSLRLHLLESESEEIRRQFGLSAAENIDALRAMLQLTREVPQLNFDLFTDMRNLLRADDRRQSCIWAACDPYTTRAVRGIEGQGQKSNCGRTNKDGVDFVKAATEGFERYVALYHTPQSAGGCHGCRFFLMCKGQCPGTAIDGDWRNRTEHCEIWMALLTMLEQEIQASGETPLSLSPLRSQIEASAVERWSKGKAVSLARLMEASRGAASVVPAL